MSLFGMDGGESLRGGAGLAALGVVIFVLGAIGLGAASEEQWSRAFTYTGLAAMATVVAHAGQAYWSRRKGATVRAIYAAMAGGPPAVLALVSLLFAAGHLLVGEWAATAFNLAVSLAGAGSGYAAWWIFDRTKARILPPFHPLKSTAFATDPDPPAYPAPRELRIARPPKAGFLARLRRALWSQRK
jgi:hypothetical protein